MTTTKDNPSIQPYLFFNGDCEEALEFYRKNLGAEVEVMMRYNQSPDPSAPGTLPPGSGDKIMHACFRIGQTRIMASDDCGPEKTGFQGFSLSLAVPTEQDADRFFTALADGGHVKLPLTKTFFSPKFAMLEDRFGVAWMINVTPSQ